MTEIKVLEGGGGSGRHVTKHTLIENGCACSNEWEGGAGVVVDS